MMNVHPYKFDSERRVWLRPGYGGIAYSDGDDAENRIATAIDICRDLSTGSGELAQHIQDWPSEYHLSGARHNLLRPFDIGPGKTVLELGCGCGAITRFLGESRAQVVAVEGSLRRAQIAASRCRDLSNVAVYCDNLIDFVTEDQFDYVTLIGVLEYAPKLVGGKDPVLAVLNHARSFLKNGGALILAIENQLGLKYFNGCSEDHVGIPYYGISDLYTDNEPITFGRFELAARLGSAGLSVQEFFYPFPDYKLPGVILSEAALGDDRLNVADLLILNTGRTYPETHHRAFAEDLAWRVAIRNQLLPDLANSFLVLARLNQTNHRKTGWLAKMYGRGRRHPCYQVETTITPDGKGNLVVRKQKIFPATPTPGDVWFQHVVEESEYLSGHLLIGRIHGAMAREAGLEELTGHFTPWLRFLFAHVTTNANGEKLLPAYFVDCIPANLIETPTGELRFFDAEWASRDSIPIAWIVVRGIVYSLIDCLENTSIKQMTYRQLIVRVTENVGISLREEDFITADQYEARLVTQCHADASDKPRLVDFLDTPLFLMIRLANRSSDYRSSLAWHQAELTRVKKTVSWRITTPLRVIWNLLLRLTPRRP